MRHWGTIPNRADHVRRLAEKLGSDGRQLYFCYEAGPCGYGLHRQLTELGHDCMVVAPSLIPVKAGDRVKTDRRDALMLAKLHRAGELTAVWVPDRAHEAMRDLIRARATAVSVAGKARQHLQGFLLRHGRIHPGKKGWTKAYRRWLSTVRFEHSAQQIVLQDYVHAVTDAEARIERLTKQIADLLPSWSFATVVEALQAMRGVAFIVAVTVVAEVGDFSRFDNPRQLMAYLGLTPSEHSTGKTIRRGGITKAGSGLARRVQTDRPALPCGKGVALLDFWRAVPGDRAACCGVVPQRRAVVSWPLMDICSDHCSFPTSPRTPATRDHPRLCRTAC